MLDQLHDLSLDELAGVEIRASKALAFSFGPNEAPITVLSLVTELRRLRDLVKYLTVKTAHVKQLREALTQVKVDHLNKKVSLPLQTHALMENALHDTE
jgi:hypothetical protein